MPTFNYATGRSARLNRPMPYPQTESTVSATDAGSNAGEVSFLAPVVALIVVTALAYAAIKFLAHLRKAT